MTIGDPTDPPHCITCGDQGIPMRVAESRPDGTAICVDDLRERHAVAIDLVEGAEPGDTLLVHAGVAIARLGAAR
jgi:hydrogenase maturation factor